MQFSVRRYYGYLIVEILLGVLVALLIGVILARFFATANLQWLSMGKKTLWWDFGWIKQKSPWGFLISFFVLTGFGFGLVQAFWALTQWAASFFASKVIRNYEGRDNQSSFSIAEGVRILFHPFRRMACLLSNNPDTSTEFPSIAVFDQRQKFLADNDKKVIAFPWKLSKLSVTIAFIISWFLSMFVFYTHVTTVVSGQSAVNNLWIYFTSSFRIFLHTFIIGLIVMMLTFVANRFAQLYLLHLDNLVYDEILPRLEKDSKHLESLKELVTELSERIEKLERIIIGLARSSLGKS